MKNLSETEFLKFIKFIWTQQLTKLCNFLRESGDFLHMDKEVAFTVYCSCIIRCFLLVKERNKFMLNVCRIKKKAQIIKNFWQTAFHKVYKVSSNPTTH